MLARRRWDRPEHVARRVERIVAEITALPRSLTTAQRDALLGAVRYVSER